MMETPPKKLQNDIFQKNQSQFSNDLNCGVSSCVVKKSEMEEKSD